MSPVWTDGKLNDLLKYQAPFSVSWTPSIIQKKLGCAKIVRVFVSWNWLFIDCCTDEGALGHYFLLLLLFVLFCRIYCIFIFITVFSHLMFIVWFDTQKDRQEAGQVPPVSNLWHGSSDFAFEIYFAVDCCCILSSKNLLVKPAQIQTSFMQCKWRCTQHHACVSGELQNIRCCNPAMFFSLRLMQLVIHCSIYKKCKS